VYKVGWAVGGIDEKRGAGDCIVVPVLKSSCLRTGDGVNNGGGGSSEGEGTGNGDGGSKW
jgi:hypothetical protein